LLTIVEGELGDDAGLVGAAVLAARGVSIVEADLENDDGLVGSAALASTGVSNVQRA